MSRIAITLIVAGAVAAAGTASAQPDGDAAAADKAEARKLLRAGDKLLQRGDRLAKRGRDERAKAAFERALESYNQAHERVPNPSIYFPIGQAEERLGRYLDALRHYQQVIDESEELNESLRQAVEERIQSARQNVATLVVSVNEPGAEITVDGESRGAAPLDGPLYLEPGEHRVAASADGFSPREEVVTIEVGQEHEQRFELERIQVVTKEPVPVPEPEPVKQPEPPSRAGLLVGGIITLALAGGATATGLGALAKEDTFNDAGAAIEDREAARDAGKTLALATDLLIAGAVIAGTYTAYHYVKVYRPQRAEYDRKSAVAAAARADTSAAAPKVWVAPYVHSKGGGLALGGRF